ncbi:MAG: fibronectin type III-like domain-contianing protein, partial [Micromonosporaceae bacterium]
MVVRVPHVHSINTIMKAGSPPDRATGAAYGRALAAYTRITLRPGQSTVVWMHVPKRQLQYWDTTHGWVTATGHRPLYVATNERGT